MSSLIKILVGNDDREPAQKMVKDFKKAANKLRLDSPEKILILYYLDFFDHHSNLTNDQKGTLLGLLFGSSGENIRKTLSDIRKIQTEDNLTKILPILENLKLTEAVSKAKSDLELLQKKKSQ